MKKQSNLTTIFEWTKDYDVRNKRKEYKVGLFDQV